MNDDSRDDMLDRYIAFFDESDEVDCTPEEVAAFRRRVEELCAGGDGHE